MLIILNQFKSRIKAGKFALILLAGIMKLIQLEKKNIQTLIVIVVIQIVFFSHSGYGQFHWGSNSRPALARLRALVQQQLRTPGHFYYVQKV